MQDLPTQGRLPGTACSQFAAPGAIYGLVVAFGLYFIGVPNASLSTCRVYCLLPVRSGPTGWHDAHARLPSDSGGRKEEDVFGLAFPSDPNAVR